MDDPVKPETGFVCSITKGIAQLPLCMGTTFRSSRFSQHSAQAKFEIALLDSFIKNLHYKHAQVLSPNRAVKRQLQSTARRHSRYRWNNYNGDYNTEFTDAQWLHEKPGRTRDDPVVLFYHGGGYVYGLRTDTQLKFVAAMAKALGPEVSILIVDYRLKPYPEPVQRNIDLWYQLFAVDGLQNVITMGDSAGAHLILLSLGVLVAGNLDQKNFSSEKLSWWSDVKIARLKHVLISPWIDLLPLDSHYESTEQNMKFDILNKYRSQGWGRFVTMICDPPDLLKIEYGDWLNNSNVLTIVGENEMLKDSTLAFNKKVNGVLKIETQGVHDQFTMEEFLGYDYSKNVIFDEMLDFILKN